MQFDETATAVAEILRSAAHERLELPGWIWESKLNRVQLSEAPANNPFRFIIARQRYELNAKGDRCLQPRQPNHYLGADEKPERIAEAILSELTNPF